MERIAENQFHDIIPGSSIKDVYDQSDRDYERIGKDIGNVIDNSLDAICAEIQTDGGYFVYNPHSYVCSDCVEIDGKTVFAKDIPPFGWKVVKDFSDSNSIKVSNKKISNRFFDISFDDDMNIISIVDKIENREIIEKGQKANLFVAYEDIPRYYDAWEITYYYKQKPYFVNTVTGVTMIEDGVRAIQFEP